MNVDQWKRVLEYLSQACGNDHSALEGFLKEFKDTKYQVNRYVPFKDEVQNLLKALEQRNALEPKFALALQAHFPNATELVLVARDILIADPLDKLAAAFAQATEPEAVTGIAAEKYAELRPRYATDDAKPPAHPAEFAKRLAGFESKGAVVKFALLFRFVWQVSQAAVAPLGPAADALNRWLDETAGRVTRTPDDRATLLAAARQAGGSGRAPLRHVVVLVAPTKDAAGCHVHAWVMAEDGSGAICLTDRSPPAVGPDAVVAEDKAKRAGTVQLDDIRVEAGRHLSPDDPEVWYEFILPPGLIDKPLADGWLLDRQGYKRDRRLGARHVVVIRSDLPYSPFSQLLDGLRDRWRQHAQCLAGGACAAADPTAANFPQVLDQPHVHCCQFTRPYRPNFDADGDALYAALGVGVPVAVWWRSAPPPGTTVTALPLADLPRRVRDLRSAGASDLVLFWDDPRRRPPDDVH